MIGAGDARGADHSDSAQPQPGDARDQEDRNERERLGRPDEKARLGPEILAYTEHDREELARLRRHADEHLPESQRRPT